MKFNIRHYENFHILLWLIKDLCWVSLSRSLGVFMIIPTVSLAIYITIINRADKAELAHNLAVCFWISANSVWMLGEFYLADSTRSIATVLFILGLLMMLRYYLTAAYKYAKHRNEK